MHFHSSGSILKDYKLNKVVSFFKLTIEALSLKNTNC